MFLSSVSKVVRNYLDPVKNASIINATLNGSHEDCMIPKFIRPSHLWSVLNFGLFADDYAYQNVRCKRWIISEKDTIYSTENGDIIGGPCAGLLSSNPKRINLLTIDYDTDTEDAIGGFPFDKYIVDHVVINEDKSNRFDIERKMNDIGYLRIEENIYIPAPRLLAERMSIRRPPVDVVRRS